MCRLTWWVRRGVCPACGLLLHQMSVVMGWQLAASDSGCHLHACSSKVTLCQLCKHSKQAYQQLCFVTGMVALSRINSALCFFHCCMATIACVGAESMCQGDNELQDFEDNALISLSRAFMRLFEPAGNQSSCTTLHPDVMQYHLKLLS